jgi:hypothetical protein
MPPTYVYPTTSEIEMVEQKLLPRLTADSPVFEVMPFDSSDAELLIWEQLDNFTGLQQLRGYNGKPQLVNRIGAKRYIAQPGVYGEYMPLDEHELTTRRRYGTLGGGPIDVSDLVAQRHEQLLNRRINLIEKICWDLLINGTFSISNPTNGVTYSGSYTQQTFTPTVPWNTLATATPLADLRTLPSFEAGQSVSFRAGSFLICNYVTANYLLNNQNANDLFGKRIGGGNTTLTLNDVNNVFVMNDIPSIRVYNGGYIDSTNTWQYFIPNGKLLLVGRRVTGSRIGFYRFTRNVNSPNAAPTPYVRVIDHSVDTVPPVVEVHDGHNGGPVIQFPGSIIKINGA